MTAFISIPSADGQELFISPDTISSIAITTDDAGGERWTVRYGQGGEVVVSDRETQVRLGRLLGVRPPG